MKKFLFAAVGEIIATGAPAQDKGRFEVYDFDNFKLHVYYTNDALGDASFIVEGSESVALMEEPLFKDNTAEFEVYLNALAKPVAAHIVDYHTGGAGSHDVTMPEGMGAFTKGAVYGGMMQGFAQAFGDAINPIEDPGTVSEVAFGSTREFAGVPFEFRHGAASDFPAASILIGNKVYYTHWALAKAHVSHLQVSSAAAVDAELAEAENALASGAELFIGGHGGATKKDAVAFRIDYLKTMKRLLAEEKTAESFAEAMKNAYPNLPGEEGVAELAKALYR